MSDEYIFEIEFPPVGPANLIRLAKDLLQAHSVLSNFSWRFTAQDLRCIAPISNLMSKDSPTALTSEDAEMLTKSFREAVSALASPVWFHYSAGMWFRVYAHSLLREPRIFRDIELRDDSPDYMPTGFTDTWKALYRGELVCIKAMRTHEPARLKEIERTYRREANGDLPISHPNLLPVIEVSETRFPFCVMSPWMPDGNILQYAQANPGANRLTLIAQACQGLMYLHGLDILHGAITPTNILIARDGQAYLADFGIAGAFIGLTLHTYMLESLRYMAPESFVGDTHWAQVTNHPSKESDIYSLAMTAYEAFTGIPPFKDSTKDNLITHIKSGQRPPRPVDQSQNQWLQDRVWEMITTSWSGKPQQRCELSVMHRVLSTPSRHELLHELPPVSRKNLLLLAEELLYTFLILPLDPGERAALRKTQEYISKAISRDRTSISSLSREEAAALGGTFREATSILSSRLRPSSFRLWLRLYTHALLLESRIFAGLELSDEALDYIPAGFTDVWKGNFKGKPVCIKAIRTQDTIRLREIENTFYHDVDERGPISHQNVLPIIEVSETVFPFCIMSPWMPNGNIMQYTKLNPDANRLMLLAQTCKGLVYLHGRGILHGGIAPGNILITRDGKACIADFGIVGVFRDLTYEEHKLETLRYMAPERLSEDLFRLTTVIGPSEVSDVYSLAMTSFEVLTGILPYEDSYGGSVVADIRLGKRPPRPTDPTRNEWLHNHVWDVITTCWSDKPEQRSGLSALHHTFSTLSPQIAKTAKSARSERQALQRRRTITRIVSFLQTLRGSEPGVERLVDDMDRRLEDLKTSDRERLKLLNKLCKTCSRHRVIPNSMHIPDCSKDSVEVERGGFADVSQGTYQGRRVAIKIVRVYATSDLGVILSSFCREGVAWKHLRHPNVLPLLGVTISENRFAMVSEWMDNGNIIEFVARYEHLNRAELLVDVASGLSYMHGLRMVHGDLKGANILINKNRRACLADFGLSTITGIATHAAAEVSRTSLFSNDTLMSFTSGGTRRWMSPELLDPEMFGIPPSEGDRPTRQSDCYALGMVIYEVLCGHHPYAEVQSDIMVVNEIMEGVRPKKPEDAKRMGLSDELWRMIELCWLEDRNARPGVDEILSSLKDATAFWFKREAETLSL